LLSNSVAPGYRDVVAETELQTPRGTVNIRRPHTSDSSPLRGWSAADQLILDHLGKDDLGSVLVVNDEFGALAVALADVQVTTWGDSVFSRTAVLQNLDLNGLGSDNITLVAGDSQPRGHFDTIVIRLPKTTALLAYQLQVLASLATPATRFLGVGMARHIHRSTLELFETLGPTVSSKATRKARLLRVQPIGRVHDVGLTPTTETFVTAAGIRVVELPGTFSAGHVDAGTALLIEVLCGDGRPQDEPRVADLGCGNGVLATSVARSWGSGTYTLLDTSDLAIAAAKQTWQQNGLDPAACDARAKDGFEGIEDGFFDVVITNPPFHQGHAVDRDMTDRLLSDAARVLTSDGRLYVVAQRHLQIHTRLKRWFGHVETRSQHPTHVVLAAIRPKQR